MTRGEGRGGEDAGAEDTRGTRGGEGDGPVRVGKGEGGGWRGAARGGELGNDGASLGGPWVKREPQSSLFSIHACPRFPSR